MDSIWFNEDNNRADTSKISDSTKALILEYDAAYTMFVLRLGKITDVPEPEIRSLAMEIPRGE